MSRRIRSTTAALLAASLFIGAGFPSAAWGAITETEQSAGIHPVADALFMRPLGFASVCVGAILFIPAGAFTALTRPQEMQRPWNTLVMNPVRYTWIDPLGSHPRE